MIYMPSEYMGLDIPIEMKKILMKSRNKFGDETIVLINVKPFFNDVFPLGFLIMIGKKVIYFSYQDIEQKAVFAFESMHNQVRKIFKDNIIDKILTNITLKTDNWLDKVEFTYKVITKTEIDSNTDLFISISKLEKQIERYTNYTEDKVFLSFERVNKLIKYFAPEYCILRRVEKQKALVELSHNELKNSNRISSVLRLNHEQINYINKLNKGNELILASAGSGKSVLLIAKAIHIAKQNNNEKFLILTYNKNLCEAYKWKITSSGMTSSNLHCYTYDMFMNIILINENQNRSRGIHGIDQNRERVYRLVKSGVIKERYTGIFIDEAQIFKPEWLDVCYYMLKDINKSRHYFYICGDKSQQVNNTIIEKSPWELLETDAGDFDNIHRIDKNYRNTKQINKYLNCFLKAAKLGYISLKIHWSKDENYFLRGEAIREGPDPELIVARDDKLVDEIIEKIAYFNNECGIADNDIAIVFHTTRYKHETRLHRKIIAALEEKHIYYSIIHGEDKKPYSTYSGVAVTTIDSSLGLDFQAVLLCGLENIGKYYSSAKLNENDQPTEDQIEEIYIGVNKLYTALSRAREHLCILLDQGDNWYYNLLKEAKGEYDVRM